MAIGRVLRRISSGRLPGPFRATATSALGASKGLNGIGLDSLIDSQPITAWLLPQCDSSNSSLGCSRPPVFLLALFLVLAILMPLIG